MYNLTKCALCGNEAELELSHTVPKMAVRTLKKTAIGNIRSTENPNKTIQDSEKLYMLCGEVALGALFVFFLFVAVLFCVVFFLLLLSAFFLLLTVLVGLAALLIVGTADFCGLMLFSFLYYF